jgi:hypothetical protein
MILLQLQMTDGPSNEAYHIPATVSVEMTGGAGAHSKKSKLPIGYGDAQGAAIQ